MVNKLFLCVFLTLTALGGKAQVNRYMVFFNDKTGTPYSISNPEEYLSQRALDRRANQNIAVTSEDLPVNPAYLQALRDDGYTVLYPTKWMNGVLVECTEEQALLLTTHEFVNAYEFVAPGARPVVGGRLKASSKFMEETSPATLTNTQISMIGMDRMHEEGYRGEGVLIAIMDSGFPGVDTIRYFKHIFDEGRIDLETSFDFVSGGNNVFRQHPHGTYVLSTIGGFKEGSFVGGAYKANFLLFVTEYAPTEYRVEEYNWLFAAERADSAGVDVINTSLGYSTFDDSEMDYTTAQMDGETAVITKAAKIAANKGIAVVVSAGNEGAKPWKIITAPADGKNVLAVGAVTSSLVKTAFSSTGPSSDGRIKPDVAAMGYLVTVVSNNGDIVNLNGTSFAGPLTASLVAGFRQKLPDLTAAELLEEVRKSASQYATPDNNLGYGIPNFSYLITSVEDEQALEFRAYPNPTRNDLIIEFDKPLIHGINITMMDSRGAKLSATLTFLEMGKYQLNLSDKPPGLYMVGIQTSYSIQTIKILKAD